MVQSNQEAHESTAGAWVAIAAGAIMALIGLALAVGGAWLAALGGSLYYLLAGLALLASGALILIGLFAYLGYPR